MLSPCSALLRSAFPAISVARLISSEEVIQKELRFGCHNYHPLPVALTRGEGVFVWDVEGRRYFDFLSGYSATNLGHCHPRLVQALSAQAGRLHHTSRAFHSDVLAELAQTMCSTFQYDKLLPMNTGVEACESSCKLARKWGYEVKGIAPKRARIVFAQGNFWGRSLAAVSSSCDPLAYSGYEPLMTGFDKVPFDDLDALEIALQDPDVCAFMVEPIQGEAGVLVPSEGYLRGVRQLCDKYGVLWIADEVQTGLGRTGEMLCVDHEGVRPDMLVLGKALAGGLYPVSAVMAGDAVMHVMTPGTHGSTFGGNPLGCRVALESLRVLQEEQLVRNSDTMGSIMRARLRDLQGGVVTAVRGKGLMNAIDINPEYITAWELCLLLQKSGILSKPTHSSTVRLTPPLVISAEQLHEAMDSLEAVVRSIPV